MVKLIYKNASVSTRLVVYLSFREKVVTRVWVIFQLSVTFRPFAFRQQEC